MPTTDQGVQPQRFQLIPRVLIFLTYQQQVLLIKGAPTKRIWANKYNGVGGHVERAEDVYSAAVREVKEETGLDVADLRLRGVITIDTGQPTGIGMFVFTGAASEWATVSSSEGKLEWIPFERVLDLDLVEDLPTLLPEVLALADDAPVFFGRYWYDAEGRLEIRFA